MPAQEIVFVTGPAGAGRSTAINALEDFGFEAIDNMPLSLVERLLGTEGSTGRPLALGIDPRTRDFSPDGVVAVLLACERNPEISVTLLFVDCSVDTLLRRFSETRRRHPMARNEAPRVGIERELELLQGLRQRADIVIDTTELSPHELRADLERWFSTVADTELSVLVQSFSFKRGIPRGSDSVFDVRFLRNPHWEAELREQDGRAEPVRAHVEADPLYSPFFERLLDITSLLLPAYKREGKSYFSIGIGCTGGQHRSVVVAESLAKGLAVDGWQVSIRHRELELRGAMSTCDQG